jgi:choline dehydrogenase-like flavoprotein
MYRRQDGLVVKEGIVGENLRVRGFKNLSVADASVIPAIPSFPTAKLCTIIGAIAADILIGSKQFVHSDSQDPLSECEEG